MTPVYIKVDQLGLYMRFGAEPVHMFEARTWGGFYTTDPKLMPKVGGLPPEKITVAFEVFYGQEPPWAILAQRFNTTAPALQFNAITHGYVSPGTATAPSSDRTGGPGTSPGLAAPGSAAPAPPPR